MERKFMRDVKVLEDVHERKNGVKGIYTKQMDSPVIVDEVYGVVKSLHNMKTPEGVEHRMIIKAESGTEISTTNERGFKVGDEVVYIGTIFNRPATKEEIEKFEERFETKGVIFVPVCTNEIYLASEYEQMKNNGGPKR